MAQFPSSTFFPWSLCPCARAAMFEYPGLAFQRVPPAYRAHKSGRRAFVILSASASRQARILSWWPEVKTSGTLRLCHSCGRVYWGYSSSPCSKLSSARLSTLPTIPGNNLTQASINTIAAGSPPERTKSPRLTSSIGCSSRTRWSRPSNRPQMTTTPEPPASSRTRA